MRARSHLVNVLCSLLMLLLAQRATAQDAIPGTTVPCAPVSERAGRELGCWVLAHHPVGRLSAQPTYWHLATYPTRAAAEAARPATGTVVESFGTVWLFTIAELSRRVPGGDHVAEIGPLPLDTGTEYTARYLEAVFTPGMISVAHRHGGPEAWYTLVGATCLETPEGKMVGRAGSGDTVIVPGGVPMHLTAIGNELRRGFALILYDSARPHTTLASDWTPKGLCKP